MLNLVGYASAFSVAPGQTIDFKVSAEGVPAFEAQIVRLIHGDANPAGPGFRTEPVTTLGRFPGRHQPVALGSAAIVDLPAGLPGGSLTIAAMIWPTLPGRGAQAIVAQAGWSLGIDDAGALAISAGSITLSTGRPLLERQWYLAAATIDATSGTVTLVQRPLSRHPLMRDDAVVTGQAAPGLALTAGPLVFAAAPTTDGFTRHYDGKIDSPRLVAAAVEPDRLLALFEDGPGPDAIAAWDFSRDIPTDTIVDAGPRGLHGRTVNLPARAMTGWNWSGEHRDWTLHPAHYGAIHFHADDMADAGWQTDFSWTVPQDQRSAVYCARITSADGRHEDHIPFAVRPPRGTARAEVAFLLPTASYLAYANDHGAIDPQYSEMLGGRLLAVPETDLYLDRRRDFGLSLYDSHADGSGVCYTSRQRPILNFRPKYQSFLSGPGGGLWQFNADTHLLDWLEASQIPFDVITDEDLHAEGAALLTPYRVILTGSHPEYYSLDMWDAMKAWQDGGGRLMYLGGNGFYWRVAFHPSRPGVMEVRRAEDGIRTWEAAPGEYHHSFTGEYGGMWRRQGRPPNVMCGVGFTAQGFDLSSYYRRQPGSFDPRAAFIFDGVGDDERIGDFGLVNGGAAGLELDRAEPRLGTPPHALVLASSEGHSDLMLLVNEEFSVTTPNLGGTQHPNVRADLVFYETAAGGAVFSTGSIAWCGSLSHNGYDNNVSRIMRNVLRRFRDPQPFAV